MSLSAIYLDHAATTPLDPEILEAMMPYLTERYGNASSLHAAGRVARHAVEEARSRMAAALETDVQGIIFTSGGTESDNAAVLGVASTRSGTIVTGATEHEAVLQPVRALGKSGRGVVIIEPRSDGSIDPGVLSEHADAGTALVSIMHTNNETGCVNDLPAISQVCRANGIPLHCDAVQATAYFAVSPSALGADLVSISAHKIGGPKGVGALLLRTDTSWAPSILGGNQERRRRGGTENVASIVGFGHAVEKAVRHRDAERLRIEALRDRLRSLLAEGLGDRIRFVSPVAGAPHILYSVVSNGRGRPLDAEMLLLRLDLEGVQASAGSACTSGTLEPGHVLSSIGLARVGAPLRLSLGRTTTAAEIEAAATIVTRVVLALGESTA